MNRTISLLLTAVLLSGACDAAAQSEPATVLLVRHAERAAEPKDDPALSETGQARVQALLAAVRDAGVSVIYTTDRRRNLETARQIAEALSVPLVTVPIASGNVDEYARAIEQRIRKEGGGRVSLVVGHSNTYAPVIKALGGPPIEAIADDRYDDLFVLTVETGAPTRVVRAKYGSRWQN